MTRKKRLLLGIIVVLAIVIILVVIWFLNENRANDKGNKELKYKVPVSSWDDLDMRYVICTIENDDISTNFSETYTTFQSDLSLQELAAQNEDFIEEITWMNMSGECRANLYFSDNRYYLLLDIPDQAGYEGYYMARSVGSKFSPLTNVGIAFVPMPMDFNLGEDFYELFGEDYAEIFFERISFEDACKFYERYTGGVAEIDYESKRIYVDARELAANVEGLMDNYVCIDFANHRFICDEGGEHEVIFE